VSKRTKFYLKCWELYKFCISEESEYYAAYSFGSLGLFIKDNKRILQNSNMEIPGDLNEITECEFNTLKDAGYPSLYKDEIKYYIVSGPISLVNHSCDSKLHFSYNNGQISLEADSDITLTSKKQIFANYSNSYFINYNCKCRQCNKTSNIVKPDTDSENVEMVPVDDTQQPEIKDEAMEQENQPSADQAPKQQRKKGRRPASDLAAFQAITAHKRKRFRTSDESMGDNEIEIEESDMNNAAYILSGLRK